jgi:excisionase family DNA binding protein
METLTPAEVAQQLGVSPNRVRQLLRDGRLMAVPGSGNSQIPADFLQSGAILKHLPGLLTVLRDGGFSEQDRCRRCAATGTPRSPGARRRWRSEPVHPGDGAGRKLIPWAT